MRQRVSIARALVCRLSPDPRYATQEQQRVHRAALQSIFRDGIAGDTTAHKPVAISNTLAILKRLLLGGVGIAFHTRLGFAEELASGRLVAVPLEGERLSTLRLCLIAPSERKPTVAAHAVAEHLQRALDRFAAGLHPSIGA